MSGRNGFTLMEILVVLIILGILTTVAVDYYSVSMTQGEAKAAQNNLITIYNAQRNYYFLNGSYCIAGCDTLSDMNLKANLNLNLIDPYFTYTCSSTSGFTCTATNIADGALILTVTGGSGTSPNSIVLSGGATCASPIGANPGCNPSCASDNSAYCPS